MITDYCVEEHISLSALVKAVAIMLEGGWKPIGGIAVQVEVYHSREHNAVDCTTTYLQAMVRETP